MKKRTPLLFLIPLLFSCSHIKGEIEEGPYAHGIELWNFAENSVEAEKEKAEAGVSLEAFPGVNFQLKEVSFDYTVLANGEETISLHPIYSGVISFYAADVNHDGYPDLCFEVSVGSGYVNEEVEIYDFHNRKSIFLLSDRFHFDYSLYLDEQNILCVKESLPPPEGSFVRSGPLAYEEGTVSIDWA